MAAHGGAGANVVRELQHTALAVRASGDGNHVLGVLDGDDDARGQEQLVVGLAKVEDVDAVLAALVNVALHGSGAVLRAQVALGRQQQRHIVLALARHPV